MTRKPKTPPWRKPGDQVRTADDRLALMHWAATSTQEVDCGRCGGRALILPIGERGLCVCLDGCSEDLIKSAVAP